MDLDDNSDLFERAAKYVALNSSKFDTHTLLQLYAWFKQAQEGPCNTNKPGLFDFQGKQKWEAWKKLGNLNKQDAQSEYVTLLSECHPEWNCHIEAKSSDKHLVNSKQMCLGVCVSTMLNTDMHIDDELKTIFNWCQEGNTASVVQMLKVNTIWIDQKDEEGMALLHWACDRGYLDMVQVLLKNGASIDIQDSDGQTPLHFALICQHPEVVSELLSHGARTDICDNEGQKALDLLSDTTQEIRDLFKLKS